MIRTLLILLTLYSVPALAATDKPENPYTSYKFEKVIGPSTIQASGKTIKLWGVRPPAEDMPHYMAATLFIEGLVKQDDLSCKLIEQIAEGYVMHCLVGNSDIGSMIIQMGLAESDKEYYAHEQELARTGKRGLWKNQVSDRF